MLESQIDTSTTERQLLYDIRTESRKTNELLAQLIEVLNPIAKGLGLGEELKGDSINGTLPISKRSPGCNDTRCDSPKHSGKRKTVHDKQHRSTTPVLSPNGDGNSGKRVSRSSRDSATSKVLGEKQFVSDL